MVGRRKKQKKQKQSRFSFIDRYSMVIGFFLFAGLLVTGYLPDHNPIPYLILGPFAVRILSDIATGQTVGFHILRNIHPRVLIIDIAVIGAGLAALYSAGYWTMTDISPIIEILNIILEPFGQGIELPETGTANMTGS